MDSITFVNFGTKWCQHCRDLEETWDRVRTETSNLTGMILNSKNLSSYSLSVLTSLFYNNIHWLTLLVEVVILTVDCDDLEEICETAEIKDFPTLALFKNSKDGKSVKQFSSQAPNFTYLIDFFKSPPGVLILQSMFLLNRNFCKLGIIFSCINYAA